MRNSAARWSLGGLLCLAAAAGLADDADGPDVMAAARSRGVLEVAVYAEFPPFSEGKSAAAATGIDVDIARAIAESLHLPLKLRLVSAGESASDDLRNHIWKGHYLGGGVADLMLHVGFDKTFAEREKNVVFFEPYFHESVAVAYRHARIPHLDSPLALTEHKIAVEGDTISDHIMSSAYGGALRASAVREQSLEDAVVAFKAGEVDGVMGPYGELQGLLAEKNVQNTEFHFQEQVGQMRTSWDLGMAVKSDGGTSLRNAVSASVESLKADGSLQKIFAKYGVTYTDVGHDPRQASTH